jgi:hypothetical protein
LNHKMSAGTIRYRLHKHDYTTPFLQALRYKLEGRGFDFRWCNLNFSWTQSFRPNYDPGVDSAFNRNECQEYFMRVKMAGA